MTAEPTDAIVLRVIDFSETSVVVTLLTRDFGRISALAKGARRPKSPFEGAIDLLAHCRVMLIHKPGETLDLLTEAKLTRRFRAGQSDLRRLYAGYYLVELLRELTDEGDRHPELFELAEQMHGMLHEPVELPALMTWCEARLLRLTGHFPLLDQCVFCGTDQLPEEPRWAFSLQAGGVACEACRRRHGAPITFSESARGIWRDYADSTHWSVPANWTRSVAGELRGLMTRWLTHVLGHRLKMHDLPLWQS